MSRDLEASTTDFLESATTPVTAVSFSIAAWIKPEALTGAQTVCGIYDSATENNYHELGVSGASGAATVRASSIAGGTLVAAQSSTVLSDATWYHVCGTFGPTAGTDRAAYLDGGGKGTQTTNRVPAGIDRLSVGRTGKLTPNQYFDGLIAEVGIWNVQLTDGEVAALGRGVHPTRIRPISLVGYWPLWGTSSPEQDYTRNGNDLTVTGATVGVHARVQPMLAQDLALYAVAAPAVFVPRIEMYVS